MIDMDEGRNTLLYSPSLNRFLDYDWYVVHDLHKYFDTWQLSEWKKTREFGLVADKSGEVWAFQYLVEPEEEDILEFIGWNESYGIKMDRIEY